MSEVRREVDQQLPDIALPIPDPGWRDGRVAGSAEPGRDAPAAPVPPSPVHRNRVVAVRTDWREPASDAPTAF